ncbi:MAG TPA: tetratricopeptide repeat protein [Candidatus Acidoferrales bacterium]|nr:tetratricopeptide repeat protein [Candidatus Acidoferrales bacterium]
MFKIYRLAGLLAVSFVTAFSALAQARHSFPFRATNYDVEVILHPDDQNITATVKADLVAEQVSKTVVVELHPDLRISTVHEPGGKPLEFSRDTNYPLLLTIGLPEAASPGKKVTLQFDYAGPISSEDDSPTKGVRFANIDKTSAYLLLPARWFPLTNYTSNRYTGTFKVIVPDTFVVVGTGKADSPVAQPALGRGDTAKFAYTFHCDKPGRVGSFVAGGLQLSPVQTEGLSTAVYTPPAQASTANSYATALSHIVSYFSESFGGLEAEPSWTIAQLPDGTLQGFAAPGLLLISARQWTTKANERMLSQLAAEQWWGERVMPATIPDTWITNGLSRYAEAMYAEQSDGVAGLHKALEDFAVGALMYEDTAPIAQAQRLATFSNEYRSVVADKGALVFHMLRTELGDDAFNSLLHDFYKKYEGKTATIPEFEAMAKTKVPPPVKGQPPINLTSFFAQWLNSTGIPEFRLEYITYRTPKGFKVVGKIHQDLDTFRMPVEIRVDTEGNPEFKKLLVSGTTSDFTIETFGRPKPNGIVIDPNNNLLKSSPRLRVHAAIARGEGYAELGKYYEAIQEYQRALDLQPGNSLANFRMGEAMFYQKNYQSAANAFRAALSGDLDPKWTDVWSHIYIGKIWDLLDQRARAVNEYSLAQHTGDDTAGAQAEATRFLQKPYSADAAVNATNTPSPADSDKPGAGSSTPGSQAGSQSGNSGGDRPVLKKRPSSD